MTSARFGVWLDGLYCYAVIHLVIIKACNIAHDTCTDLIDTLVRCGGLLIATVMLQNMSLL